MARGEGRREQIIGAARTVFVRDGYAAAKLADIAAEAGCSVGTLYTYFEDRDDLLAVVLREVEEEMRRARGPRPPGLSPGADIAATNRSYLEAYRKNARLMALLEQVSQMHPGFRELRLRRARDFVGRNAQALRRMQDAGAVDPGVDVGMMAAALSAMVSRLAYAAWVDGEYGDDDAALERVLATVNRIWWSSLGMDPGGRAAGAVEPS